MLSLFTAYPKLKNNIPYVSLGEFPTPVEPLSHLGKELGIDSLYIKRDDLSGRIYGGNKVRKLELLFGEALRQGRKEVMTFGCAGSNHALATAVYAGQLGLHPISMLFSQPNASYIRKNLLMSLAVQTEIHYYREWAQTQTGARRQSLIHLFKTGRKPYMIPAGGSSPLGTIGFVNAAFELKEQVEQGKMPEPDYIYVPLGTMGTAAGLALGVKALGMKTQVIPVRVVGAQFGPASQFLSLYRQASELLRAYDSSFPETAYHEDDLMIEDNFLGRAYAVFTKEGMSAVNLIHDTEGVGLEGTYTGKTLAALMSHAKSGRLKGKTVLFWNTLNSRDLSEYTSRVDYHDLSPDLQRYFTEDVQALDKK